MTIATGKPALGRKLLKGGAAIADRICGEETDPKKRAKNRRWLYGQIHRLPIWSLEDGGELFAWEDEIVAHLEERAAEAQAARIAAAAAKIAKKETLAKDAASAVKPRPRAGAPKQRRNPPPHKKAIGPTVVPITSV